ncbi:hypothetical protein KZY47_004291 [Vibrio vulnificus]|nr:hypothetical protein [Vibrio vulnificus]
MKSKICLTVAVLALIAPIVFYTLTFGIGIWDSHSDWAAMGSALGGLYTPILALLTLAVLLKQLQIQEQVKDYEQRETSRKTVFEMVEKFSSRIELQLNEELIHKLRILSELPKGDLRVASMKSELMDVFTLWTSVRAYIKNYAKSEPILVVDLLSIPVLHLNFSVCYDIDKAYLRHIASGKDEVYLYRL